MITMYPGKVNSPATTLASVINATQTTIPLMDASVLPIAPNLAVIGTEEDCETILYTGKTGNDLTGCTREFQGTKKAWASGTSVARMFTAYDYDTLRTNLTTHEVIGIHGEIRLTPKTDSTGPEGTMFYDSVDKCIYVAVET